MKTKLLAGAALAAMFAASAAAADEPGWYGAIDLGWHKSTNLKTNSATLASDNLPYHLHFKTNDSWAGFARVGYRVSPHLRLELEGGYRDSKINQVFDGASRPV